MRGGALGLWIRVVALSAIAWTTVVVPVPTPPVTLPSAAAIAVGCTAGIVLFAVIARRTPRLAGIGRPVPVAVATRAFLGLWAVNEELVWRRFMLGEALRGGMVAALAASTIGFAVVHRARRRTHLLTGATFGGLYVASGSLGAAIAAHWTYNALVAAEVERARAPTVEVSV